MGKDRGRFRPLVAKALFDQQAHAAKRTPPIPFSAGRALCRTLIDDVLAELPATHPERAEWEHRRAAVPAAR